MGRISRALERLQWLRYGLWCVVAIELLAVIWLSTDGDTLAILTAVLALATVYYAISNERMARAVVASTDYQLRQERLARTPNLVARFEMRLVTDPTIGVHSSYWITNLSPGKVYLRDACWRTGEPENLQDMRDLNRIVDSGEHLQLRFPSFAAKELEITLLYAGSGQAVFQANFTAGSPYPEVQITEIASD